MGLDMHLYAKRYICSISESELSGNISQYFPELEGKKITSVSTEVMYWRKANAIHRWFVSTVQNGVDDCESYYVSREELENLSAICEEILEDRSRASELMPTADGFFFGDVEYSESYFYDIQRTKNELEKILEKFNNRWDFEYRSSW